MSGQTNNASSLGSSPCFIGTSRFGAVLIWCALVSSACTLFGCATQPPPSPQALIDHNTLGTEQDIREVVKVLAHDIGERNVYRAASLDRAATYIEQEFYRRGLAKVRREAVPTPREISGLPADVVTYNIEGMRQGDEGRTCTIVVGAHYDTKVKTPGWHAHGPAQPGLLGTPGANDNASGIAALLSLASQLRDSPTTCAIRFVAFTNEEPPFYQTSAMGSLVYARGIAREQNSLIRMISLETLGCYSPRIRAKRVPGGSIVGLPDTSDYVALLSNIGSRSWAESFGTSLAARSPISVRTVALPELSKMVAWSDDWSFWQVGLPAFAITDTAFMRHDDYRELNDTPDGLDYGPMAEVVYAVAETLKGVAEPTP